MHRVVYKYPINLSLDYSVILPQGHKVIRVSTQCDVYATMWVEADSDSPAMSFKFATINTGSEIPNGYVYQGTFELNGGDYIGHLYQNITGRLEVPDTHI